MNVIKLKTNNIALISALMISFFLGVGFYTNIQRTVQ